MEPATMIRNFLSFCRNSRGIAAIEMAFIMPFLLFLYFGLIDLTALISLNRKVTYAASVVADLVTQNANAVDATKIPSATIDDFFNAAKLVMKPVKISDVRIEIHQFRNVSGTVTAGWQKNSSGGSTCGVPSTAGMASLMTDGNDVIVAEVCTTYTPYLANFLGQAVLGATSFSMNEQIALRPRQSPKLDCTGC